MGPWPSTQRHKVRGRTGRELPHQCQTLSVTALDLGVVGAGATAVVSGQAASCLQMGLFPASSGSEGLVSSCAHEGPHPMVGPALMTSPSPHHLPWLPVMPHRNQGFSRYMRRTCGLCDPLPEWPRPGLLPHPSSSRLSGAST